MTANAGASLRACARRAGRLGAFLLVSLACAAARAATFPVTNLNDSGAGSLRDAIGQANTSPGPDTITFAVNGTIVLTSGQIQISEALTIAGPGADKVLIDGNANERIFIVIEQGPTPACPALTGPTDYLVTISGVTLQNARRHSDHSGGAIHSSHSLIVDSVVIRDNQAKAGAGISFLTQYPGQSLTITNSAFYNNIAKPLSPVTTTSHGGAFRVVENCGGTNINKALPATVMVMSSLFSGNRVQPTTFSGFGGAIFSNAYADITIQDSRVVGNFVDAPNPPVPGLSYHGGGIRGYAKSWTILRSEISDNAVLDATLSDQTRGGGIHFFNSDPNLQGLADVMPVKIVNSTISGNSVPATAGAMLVFGNAALELDNTTVAFNIAAPNRTGGIVMSTGATSPPSAGDATAPTLKMVSSILARSSASTADLSSNTATMPSFTVDATKSLIQSICPTCNITVGGSGNLTATEPHLVPLGFHGGPTRTNKLEGFSPAIDAGANPLALPTDQRGFARVVGAAADIGAYEAGGGTYNPGFAYFITPGGTLQIVDTATNALIATVPVITVGNNPYAAVVNPAGTRVFVSNFNDNTVSTIDPAARKVVRTIPVSNGPQGIAVNPAGTRVYVACFTAGIVSVIDATNGAVIASIPVPGATDLVVNNQGNRLYVASGSIITIVDTGMNNPIGSIPLTGLSAVGTIAISPDDKLVYAWANMSARIAVVDTASATMTTTISIPAPFANDGIAFHPAGRLAYHSTGTQLSVIDTSTNQVLRTIPLGTTASGVNGVAVSADGTRVYAATANGVRAVDTATSVVTPVGASSVRAMGRFVGRPASALVTSFSGPVATGVGSARASMQCTGTARCLFTRAAWISPPGKAGSPPVDATIAGVAFPYGLLELTAVGTPGFTATFTLVFPNALPPGTSLYKYGPTAGNPLPHWYAFPATIAGNVATFTVTDGGAGDDDLVVNAAIVDSVGVAVAFDGRVLMPDGTSILQTFTAYPETRWFALTVEPGKTYVIEAADAGGDLGANAVGAIALFGEDRLSAPPDASYDCLAVHGPRPPALGVAGDGVRCVLFAGAPFPGFLQDKRTVYVRVTRMDPAAGGGAQFRIRARESNVYGRWRTAGYDFHVEVENTTADPTCVWVTRYPASGLGHAPSAGWSGAVSVFSMTVPAFGAEKKVFLSGDFVGTDGDGTLRISACGGAQNLLPGALHVSTYAFDSVANRYIYFFTSTGNEGKTRSSW
jgi:YVTN family beta-propeller protein